jgi:HEAT repeat protein
VRLREALPWLERRLAEETHPAVREAALRALAAVAGGQATPGLLAALASPDAGVRAAAAAGLLRVGAEEPGGAALRELRRLAASPAAAQRVTAARTLGELRHAALDGELQRLLRDPSAQVRRAALKAAGRTADPACLRSATSALADASVAGSAASALVAAGTAALPELQAAYQERPALRVAITRVLGRLGRGRGLGFLRSRLGAEDVDVRGAVLEALRANGFAPTGEELVAVQRQLRRELEDAAATLAARRDIGGSDGLELLSQALEGDVEGHRRRLFLLLSFVYEARAVLHARDNLSHPARERRAYAQELLEVTIPREAREALMPLLESLSPTERLTRLEVCEPQVRQTPEARLDQLLRCGDGSCSAWTRAVAAYCAARGGRRPLREALARLAQEDDSPLVRETAGWSAGVLGGAGFENRRPDMLTLERVIVLKSVEMFQGASEQVLADIAAILEEVELEPGEVVFEKGDFGDSLYVIVEGRVRVLDGGRELGQLGERDIFGELALLDPEPRSARVVAVEPSKLFRLDREAFSELMAANIEIVRGVLHVLCERLRQRNEGALNAAEKSRTTAATSPS